MIIGCYWYDQHNTTTSTDRLNGKRRYKRFLFFLYCLSVDSEDSEKRRDGGEKTIKEKRLGEQVWRVKGSIYAMDGMQMAVSAAQIYMPFPGSGSCCVPHRAPSFPFSVQTGGGEWAEERRGFRFHWTTWTAVKTGVAGSPDEGERVNEEPKKSAKRNKWVEVRGDKKKKNSKWWLKATERRAWEVNLVQISIVTEQEGWMRRVVTGSG